MNGPYYHIVANVYRTRDYLDRNWRYYRKLGNVYFAMHIEDYHPQDLLVLAGDLASIKGKA